MRAAVALSLLALSACGLNQEGVAPPRDHISFPASALVDPGGDWLYVVNSNSDLRYNNGTLVTVNLVAAAADRKETWEVCPYADYVLPSNQPATCCWDFLDHTILDCDERRYVASTSTVEIGSFGSGMVMQNFAEPACPATPTGTDAAKARHDCECVNREGGRLFIGVRGNSSLTYTDVSYDADGVPTFSCPTATGGQHACKVTETVPTEAGDPLGVPDEPYTLALDKFQDLLYVGHLKGDVAHPATGGVSLFDVHGGSKGVPPTFIGASQGFFQADGNGLFGVTSLTPHNGLVYATSRYGTSAVGMVTSPAFEGVCPMSTTSNTSTFSVVPGGDNFVTPLLGVEIRGIQFPPDSTRAFMLQRIPPALIGYDIANGPGGLFGNVPTDIIETCQAPTFLQQAGEGADARLYVTCFESGQVYVVDPFVPRLTNVIEVGRGPAGLAFAPKRAGSDERLAYVVGFSANNISVVDLTPGSPTQFHVIQRIGFPSAVPR